MSAKPKIIDTPAQLRRRAERENSVRKKSAAAPPHEEADTLRLLHELEVHQIELEMQNTELRLARDEADGAREKYADLYDFAPVGYFTILANGTIRMANLAGSALAGMVRSRLVGRSFEMLVPIKLRPEFREFLKQVFAGEAGATFETTLSSSNLSDRFVSLHAHCAPGCSECSVAVIDITRRKQDEDALRDSEMRYRRLFEAAHDGVLLLDPDTRKITDANPFMTRLLGYSHDQLVGKELFEIGLMEDEAASREMFKCLKKTHEARYDDLPLESRSGEHQNVEVVANLYQEGGRPVIQCNIRDITQRKQVEDMLRRNEALFATLIGQAPVGIYVVDSSLRLQQANPTAMKVIHQIDSPIGRDFAEVIHIIWPKRVAGQVLARFRHTLKTGECYWSPNFAERRRDIGLREIYEWQIERITLPTGEEGVVCFFNDITARVQSEKAKLRLELITASNLKLKQEIVRRQAVEDVLHKARVEESRLLDQSRQQELRLRDLSHQILSVQEEERKRISRELHDVIAQTLVGINVHVSALAQDVGAELGDLQERIAKTHLLVEHSVAIVQKFALDLRPTLLDDLGLIPALRAYLKGYMDETGIRVGLSVFSGIEKFPEMIRTAFFRIIQEALTNVTRHANATMVEILIQKLNGDLMLEISDDGEGFEVNEMVLTSKGGRLGLLGMKERAEMIGGVFSVQSAPGAPTAIRVVIKPALFRIPKLLSKNSTSQPSSSR